MRPVCTVGSGAGFAGDRIEPAVALANSGQVDAVALECLAERTLVAALRARAASPDGGADPRLRRRLAPLLPAAAKGCRIISNLGAANPAAAARATAALAHERGCSGMRIAALLGDDVAHLAGQVSWETPIEGKLIGAHAYLGADGLSAALEQGAAIVLSGRTADSALFAAPALAMGGVSDQLRAGALTVGHLLECGGQLTGGNFEPPGGGGLDAAAMAALGYPLARILSDGTAEIALLDGAPGWLDAMTCTLQLLYEVHDPATYITSDGVLDLTGIRFDQIEPNLVRMSGARMAPPPDRLKVVGFVERRGVIADVEIGYAGPGALGLAERAADTLRLRLDDWIEADLVIDIVGVDSILGKALVPLRGNPPELRMHVSARCDDAAAAQTIEDELYALTLCGPAGGAGIRSERRPRIETISGLIPREAVPWTLAWETAA